MGAFLICLTDVIRLTEYETSQKDQPFGSQYQSRVVASSPFNIPGFFDLIL